MIPNGQSKRQEEREKDREGERGVTRNRKSEISDCETLTISRGVMRETGRKQDANNTNIKLQTRMSPVKILKLLFLLWGRFGFALPSVR